MKSVLFFRHHINEENKDKSKNTTMHGDTTTKKGNIFKVHGSILVRKFCLRVWHRCDGKDETNVDITKDVLSDISKKEDESENVLNDVSWLK